MSIPEVIREIPQSAANLKEAVGSQVTRILSLKDHVESWQPKAVGVGVLSSVLVAACSGGLAQEINGDGGGGNGASVRGAETFVPPTATAEASATAQAPATPEPPKKPENILPPYAVFFGQMMKEDGSAKGSIVAAQIPNYPNYLYVFDTATRTGFLYQIEKIDGKSLEAMVGFRMGGVYITPTADQAERIKNTPQFKINITLEDAETLSGNFGKANDLWNVKMKLLGTGKAALYEGAKRFWAADVAKQPTLWQNVPDATIQRAGFQGIELPEG